MAAELLSHKTATSLKLYFDDIKSKSMGDFIDVVNNWFDVFNSRSLSESQTFKKPFGTCIDEQLQVLQKMSSLMLSTKFLDWKKIEKPMQPFQKGVLLCNNSLQALLEDVKADFNYKYLMTYKLNNDALENLFSQVRGTAGGPNDCPSPMGFLRRLKIIMLGKNTSSLRRNKNTVEQSNENIEYLISNQLNVVIGNNEYQGKLIMNNNLIIIYFYVMF